MSIILRKPIIIYNRFGFDLSEGALIYTYYLCY